MTENIAPEDFNVCQKLARERKSNYFGKNYKIRYQVSCTKFHLL